MSDIKLKENIAEYPNLETSQMALGKRTMKRRCSGLGHHTGSVSRLQVNTEDLFNII